MASQPTVSAVRGSASFAPAAEPSPDAQSVAPRRSRPVEVTPPSPSRATLTAVTGAPNPPLQIVDPASSAGVVAGGSRVAPYGVLKELFERASDPIALSDIEAIDAQTHNQKCVKATSTTRASSALKEVELWSAGLKLPTVPAHGPLFPADARTDPKVGYVGFGKHDQAKDLKETILSATATATQITTQVFDDDGKPYHQNRVRKNGDLVTFEMAWPNSTKSTVPEYGYCWKE